MPKNSLCKVVGLLGVMAGCAGVLNVRAAEDLVAKSFPVSPGGRLILNADRGNVQVRVSDASSVDVQVRRTLDKVSAARAREIFEKHEVAFSQGKGEVRVTGTSPSKVGFSVNTDESRLQVSYVVTVPKKFNLDLRTAGGSISVEALEGQVASRTSAGNLNLGSINGVVTAETGGGSIEIVSGRGITAKTSAGNIRVREAVGDAALETHGGSIVVDQAGGAVKASSSAGNIGIGVVAGNVSASTAGGSIEIKKAGGTVTAKTSAGNITLGDAAQFITAQTHGGSISAHVTGPLTQASELRTSAGNITLWLPEKAALDLDAKTSAGSVSSAFDLQPDKKTMKDSLRGKLNGGGPTLVLHTAGGSIELKKL
jgi:DUF4097 and DUF4098 domain-containing protein YvlB